MQHIIVFFSIFIFIACSPNSDTDWAFLPPINGNWKTVKTYGGSEEDIAHGVSVTLDGGFVVVGNTQSKDGNFSDKSYVGSDIFLMKFDSFFNLEWTKTYGGSGDDRGHDVVQLSDGGFAAIGYSKSDDGDASLNEGQHDNWLIRTNSKGVLLWQKSFGFLGHDHAYSIIATSDGGLFFNGFLDVTASNGEGNYGKGINYRHGVGEFWGHKLNSDGEIIWSRFFGGTNNDRSYDVIETNNGEFIIVGSTESNDIDISNNFGSYDYWVIRINHKDAKVRNIKTNDLVKVFNDLAVLLIFNC